VPVTTNTEDIRWFERQVDRLARRLTQAQFTELLGRPVDRSRWGPARIALVGIAVVLLAAIVASAGFGAFLVVYHFPGATTLPGVFLLMLAAVLRPRFGRLSRYAEPVTREQAPTLFRVIDEVAQTLGTPRPHIVLVDETFNAWARLVGLRSRRVVNLGLPLLGVLSPQERVALIGHELGHFVNGDARRGLLTQLPLTVFAHLADVLRPSRLMVRRSAMMFLIDMLARVVFVVPRFLARCTHVGMVWIGARGSQRAEYSSRTTSS
jgi:heat shock protein HtpX